MFMAATLTLKLYIALFLVFAIGFGVITTVLFLLGATFYIILVFAVFYFALQWYISPTIIRFSARLRYIKDDEMPWLHEIVQDLAKEAKVPVPKIAISKSPVPNAFVFGRSRKGATLAINQGLLDTLNHDEVKAVIAHEIGHIKHNDFAVMTFISFIPMLAMLIAENVLFFGMFGRGRNQNAYAMLIGMAAFLVYLVTELLTLVVSRTRESLADEYSAYTTQQPELLASALYKITYAQAAAPQSSASAGSTERALCISDSYFSGKELIGLDKHIAELKSILPNISESEIRAALGKKENGAKNIMTALFSTHPPTYKRILDLAHIKNEIGKTGKE